MKMAVSESWIELLKLAADNEDSLGTGQNVEAAEKFFTVAHYNNPRDVVRAKPEYFVEGENNVEWPSGPMKPCIRRILAFVNELHLARKEKAARDTMARSTSPPPDRRTTEANSPSAAGGGGSPYTRDQESRLRLLGMDPTLMAATTALKETGKMVEPLK